MEKPRIVSTFGKYCVAFAITACWSLSAVANNITASGISGPRVITTPDTGKQLLFINAPNANGISMNTFSRFELTSKPLYIVNAGPNGQTARTVVIIADSPKLKNTLRVEGGVTDILVLSKGRGGRIECGACRFENVNRVTLATADPEDAAMATLGNLTPGASSRIDIHHLSAPGALSVDVVTHTLNTQGRISTVERVDKVPGDAGYKAAANGRYRASAGMVNLAIGVVWHYSDMRVHRSLSTTSTSTLKADMEANAFSISTTGPMSLSGTIDTRIDLMNSVMYNGELRVNNESILISSLSRRTLNISNVSLKSDGEVAIQSAGALNYNKDMRLDVGALHLIAKDDLTLRGQAKSIQFNAEGDNIINEGDINARRMANLKAEHVLVNRNGGVIQSDTVRLETNTTSSYRASYILNGSRTPFTSFSKNTLTYRSDYLDVLDKTRIGTFYTANVEGQFTLTNLAKPAKTSAHIIANKLYVRTRAFENINPYYVNMAEDEPLKPFDRLYENQVSVTAQERIEVAATEYVLNSSAKLGTEGIHSTTLIKSPLMINERYRVLVGLAKNVVNDNVYDQDSETFTSTTGTEYAAKVYSYSPPGVLYSMGKLDTEARSMFLNSLGYLEVLGDANFKTPSLHDRGIELNGVHQLVNTVSHLGRICRFGEPCRQSLADNGNSAPQELDSLFYVNGRALASASNRFRGSTDQLSVGKNGVTDHANYNPFGVYVRKEIEAVQATLQNGHAPIDKELESLASRGIYANINGVTSTREYSDNYVWGKDKFKLTVSRDTTFTYTHPDRYYPDRPDVNASGTVSTSESKEMTVWDAIVSQYKKVAKALKTFFSELAWWN